MTSRWMAFVAAIAFLSSGARAQPATPVGLWKNIDDKTGEPRALIRISVTNGEFIGRIEKLFLAPSEPQRPVCHHCQGELKNQPIVGMTILFGMKRDGNEYTGGRILDPANGKVYKSKMALTGDGSKLNVRGYVGMPMLGRTQVWLREE
jgi:uncharacterized protein (DUF2147 family)